MASQSQGQLEVSMELQLTDKEHELLTELLQDQQKHLLYEIAKAYHYEFKTVLRERCGVLEGILHKLQVPIHPIA